MISGNQSAPFVDQHRVMDGLTVTDRWSLEETGQAMGQFVHT